MHTLIVSERVFMTSSYEKNQHQTTIIVFCIVNVTMLQVYTKAKKYRILCVKFKTFKINYS